MRRLKAIYSNGLVVRPDEIPWRKLMASVFFFALLLRLTIASAFLNHYDTEWNIMWGIELGNGFFSAYAHVSSLDYPPLYLYPLYVVGRLMRFTEVAGYIPLRMVVIKFMPCLTDSLTCVVLYRLGAKRDEMWGLAGAALWAVNPAVIFNCAFWGQTDCVLLCAAALLFAALGQRRLVAAGVLFAVMCSTKLQGLYLAPVVGMEVLTVCFGRLYYKRFRFKNIRRAQVREFLKFIVAAAGTFAVIYLPFMIGAAAASRDKWAGFWGPLTVYREGVDKYPYITMNADNFYMWYDKNGVDDSTKLLSLIRASSLGTFFLLASVLAVVAVYVLGRRKSHWLAAYLLMEGIFMLTCRQHERYQIITLVLLMGALLQIADKRIFTVLTLQSVVIFFNQARVLWAVRERSLWWTNYHITNESMNDLMQESLIQVVQQGAWWTHHSRQIAHYNSFLNICVFFVSVILVLRFYFDKQYKLPFVERAKEWLSANLSEWGGYEN